MSTALKHCEILVEQPNQSLKNEVTSGYLSTYGPSNWTSLKSMHWSPLTSRGRWDGHSRQPCSARSKVHTIKDSTTCMFHQKYSYHLREINLSTKDWRIRPVGRRPKWGINWIPPKRSHIAFQYDQWKTIQCDPLTVHVHIYTTSREMQHMLCNLKEAVTTTAKLQSRKGPHSCA
jgi:hypothetical protein